MNGMTFPRFANIVFSLALTFMISDGLSQTTAGRRSSPLTEASPTSQGMSAARLARIDDMLKDAVTQNKLPGIVALIARNGKIVFYKAYGKADDTTGKALKRDDIFRIAS